MNKVARKVKFQEWASINEYSLALICWTCGLTNLWTLPNVFYKYGNSAAGLPLLLTNIIITIPLVFAELSIGQYTNRCNMGIWRMVPPWKGVAYATSLILVCIATLNTYITSQVLLYLIKSMSKEIPWSSCGSWATQKCFNLTTMKNFDSYSNCTDYENNVQHYYNVVILKQGSDGFEQMNIYLLICSAVVIVAVFVCCSKILTSIQRLLNFLTFIPFLLLNVLLFTSMFYPGTLKGLCKFLTPKLEMLLDYNLWFEMFGLNLYSMGIGMGGLITISSHSNFRNNVFKVSTFVPLFANARDVFFVLFVYLTFSGYCIWENIDANLLFEHKSSLLFVKIPMAFLRWPFYPHIWNCLYFAMLLLIGLRFIMLIVLVLLENLNEEWKISAIYPKTSVAFICVTIFFLNFIYYTNLGSTLFVFLEEICRDQLVLMMALIQFYAVFCIYGTSTFCKDIHFMLNQKTDYVRYIWYFDLLCLGAIFVYRRITSYVAYNPPIWMSIVHILLLIAILLLMVVYFLVYIVKNREQGFKKLMRPCSDWGNKNPDIRKDRDFFNNETPGEEFNYRQELYTREIHNT
ncbi:PREDICTED: sodium-dependent proline transporter-like [Nicrophorus vespilloides]|uniref:Sodium-dependent nutrient amino acid transporter 1 n=1 Tax=Nicrophorus vespilloides TaxID=110193 RepID=A0ABM1MT26_NICVS|nr:PREDICTED: sodium-dependent proline transporter-like [Nicrophorus vespilloides]